MEATHRTEGEEERKERGEEKRSATERSDRRRGETHHELLHLVVERQDTGTGNTTEDVGAGTLEERLDALGGDDLATGVHHRRVVDGRTRGHHHATTDGVKRVRGETGTGGDGPSEGERGGEVALEGADEDNRLDRVVETEVETTVDDDADDRGEEATVETGNAVRSERLLVDVDEAVELTSATSLGRLVVVGETGTGVVERVDEEERRGSGGSTGSDVSGKPLPVALVLLEAEQGLEVVLEGEVKGLKKGKEASVTVLGQCGRQTPDGPGWGSNG
jgi:hypothetical protein